MTTPNQDTAPSREAKSLDPLRDWYDQQCPKCKGSGVWVMAQKKDTHEMRQITDEAVVSSPGLCPQCNGRGRDFLPPPALSPSSHAQEKK